MADLTLAGPNYSSVAVSDANPVPVPGGALIDVTLSLDTSAYASGDVLADTQEIANAMRVIDGTAILESLILLDEDDQGVALDLYFFNANVAMGTENSAPSISDANARNLLGKVAGATGDYTDLGGVKVVCLRNRT